MNWVRAQVELLPETTMPEKVDTVKVDEIYPFFGDKKTDLHPDFVDRETRCIPTWNVS